MSSKKPAKPAGRKTTKKAPARKKASATKKTTARKKTAKTGGKSKKKTATKRTTPERAKTAPSEPVHSHEPMPQATPAITRAEALEALTPVQEPVDQQPREELVQATTPEPVFEAPAVETAPAEAPVEANTATAIADAPDDEAAMNELFSCNPGPEFVDEPELEIEDEPELYDDLEAGEDAMEAGEDAMEAGEDAMDTAAKSILDALGNILPDIEPAPRPVEEPAAAAATHHRASEGQPMPTAPAWLMFATGLVVGLVLGLLF